MFFQHLHPAPTDAVDQGSPDEHRTRPGCVSGCVASM